MHTDFLRYLRLFLLSFALIGLAGCFPEWKSGDDEGDPGDPDDGGNPPLEFPDPPVFSNGKFFGTAADAPQNDVASLTYFNQITPENAGKWGNVEATRDTMNWDTLDAAYQFSRDHGVPFKLHTLIWEQQRPSWIEALTPTEQLEEIEEWFSELAARYPDVEMIDVVNEPINAPPVYKDALDGDTSTCDAQDSDGVTCWDWVINAFQLARTHFPDATLILNEYRVLQAPEFTQDYLEIITFLNNAGLIDAIGEEGHFLEQTDPAMVDANLDTLATAGLPIYITEFDLNLADDARHANVMSELFPVFWEHAAVQGITHWGYREGTTWRPDAWLLHTDDTERPGMEWLVCYLGGGSSCTVPPYTPDGWQGDASGLTLQAELYDEGSGLVALGGVVAYTNDGDWIAFHGVEFQNGWNKLSVTYAKGDDPEMDDGADITIHLGSLSSPAVATVDLPRTGGWNTFDTIEIDWTPLASTQDVYVSFNAGNVDAESVANLDSVRFFMPEPPAGGGGDLVTNGDFETDTSGWNTFGNPTATLSTTAAQAYAGSQSMVAQNRTTNGAFAAYNLTSVITPNTTYTVSARVFQAGAGADTVRLAAKIDCTDATIPGGFNEFPWLDNDTAVPAGMWTELSANLMIPDCELVDVVIFFEGTAAGVDVYIDAVTVMPPADPGDGNIVTNSGFESGTTDWSSWNSSTLSTSSAQAYEGTRSLLVTSRPNTNQFAVYNLTSVVEAGTTYAVSARVYQASGSATTVRLAAKVDCGTAPPGFNEFPWLDNDTAVPSGAWTELSANLTIPDCDLVDVAIFFEGTPIDVAAVYIDAVSVIPREDLVTDGGFESGTTGWSSWNSSTLATSSAQVYSGSQSMLVTNRPNTNQFAVYELAAQPNTTYAVSARVYHNGAAATTIRLAANIDCTVATMPGGFNEFPWLDNDTAVASATWTELSASLVIPDCTLESNGVKIFFEGTPIDVTEVYIDAVSVLAP